MTVSLRGWQLGSVEIACTLLLTACVNGPSRSDHRAQQKLPESAERYMLSGTQWQLVSITSMDDKQGVLRMDEPSRFTLRLGADGQASLRLDCNRGVATWSAQGPSGDSGRFEFGPVASTRALCAAPHLDERVARELGFVRGYRVKDGRLYMSLMADGGIYEWAPMSQSKE